MGGIFQMGEDWGRDAPDTVWSETLQLLFQRDLTRRVRVWVTPVAGSVAVTVWVPAVRWMMGSGEEGSMTRVSEAQRAVPGRLVTGRSLSEPEGISGSRRKVALSAGLMMRRGSLAGAL